MNQSFSKIWIVVILIALFTGGIFAWQYFGAPEEETQTLEGGAINETADWQTYRNEKYGFEVRYPDQFVLNTAFVTLVGGTNDAIGGSFGDIQGEVVAQSAPLKTAHALPAVSFVIFPSVTSFSGDARNLEEHVKYLADLRNREDQIVKITSNATYEKIVIHNTSAYKTTYCVYDICSQTEVYFQNANDDVIRFFYSNDLCMQYEGTTCTKKVKNTLADQMLSTFKFLE